MLTTLKRGAKETLGRLGFDVSRRQADTPGRDPFTDLLRFTESDVHPVIFDVGANVGQTVAKIKAHFPQSKVFSFEPSPTTFALLKQNCAKFQEVEVLNYGIGARKGTLPFHENTLSDMSSFLEMTDLGWGESKKVTEVEVLTIDDFCAGKGINGIHLLKSDTQGYDFEVLKGAAELMKKNAINLVLFEVMFSAMYRGLPAFDEVFRFLTDRNFTLVTFYTFHYQEGKAGWTDALFINNEFHRSWKGRQSKSLS